MAGMNVSLKCSTPFARLFLLLVLAGGVTARAIAQEPADEVLRVDTRAVFLDVLVRDKRTGQPVTNLTREDFQVLDDGTPRPISYFSHDLGARPRPLALILALDLWGGLSLGSGEAETVDTAGRLSSVLNRLPAQDEVAVIATWFGAGDDACEPASPSSNPPFQTLQGLTRDRAEVSRALRDLPETVKRYREAQGSKKVSRPRSGLLCAADEVARLALARTESQTVLVVVTDDYFNFFDEAETKLITERLLRSGVTASALILKKNAVGRFADVLTERLVSTPVSLVTMKHIASQTGGDVLRVGKPEDYAAALEQIIGSMSARYSLGFTLGEDERDEGRMHSLEVRVRPPVVRGKKGKLSVTARRGYYMSRRSRG